MYVKTTEELLKLIEDTHPIGPTSMTKMDNVASSLAKMTDLIGLQK